MAYRVVHWATGGVGGYALRTTIEHPDLELAGVFVHNPDKVGKDAGELVGMPVTGVLASGSREEILALDADVVIHAPLGHAVPDKHDDDVMALLRSGKNVISTVGYASPQAHGAEYAAKLEAACLEGNATLYGSGINPDLILSRIPAGLSGMCTDVKSVRLVEVANMVNNPHAGVMVDMFGMGKRPDEVDFDSWGVKYLINYTPEIIDLLARAMDIELDRIVPAGLDLALATKDFEAAATTVAEGTVAGVHATFDGFRNEEPFIRLEFFWFVQDGLEGYPVPLDEYQWLIEIAGKPSINAVIDVGKSLIEGYPFTDEPGFYATAATVMQAVPYICAAEPGIFQAPVFAPWTPRMK